MTPKIDAIIKEVNKSNFATIRGIITGIFEILNNAKSSVNDLERIIRLDPPLAAKVLKVANSAFYASRVEFKDLKEAVLWIGFDEIKNIALTEQLYKVFHTDAEGSFSRKDLWKNSISTALLAKMVYRREFGEKGENIYTAGLLHNIGIIIMDQFAHEEFEKILSFGIANDLDHCASESQILDYKHTDIVEALGKDWKFPDELIYSVKYHHTPEQAPAEYRKQAETLFIADHFCKKWKLGYSDSCNVDEDEILKVIKNNDIETESLDLMHSDLVEQIAHLEDIGLLSND
ncbi:MAG: HDOD domain-containing protein [Candidatus Marinimicrobia bacterium]|nr:HDOD domain-containing protein [Candidatus Neomarinimicrobiota bacterium]